MRFLAILLLVAIFGLLAINASPRRFEKSNCRDDYQKRVEQIFAKIKKNINICLLDRENELIEVNDKVFNLQSNLNQCDTLDVAEIFDCYVKNFYNSLQQLNKISTIGECLNLAIIDVKADTKQAHKDLHECIHFEILTTPPLNFTTPNWNFTTPTWNYTEPVWNFTTPDWNFTTPTWNFTEPVWNFTTPNWNFTEPNWNFTEPIWNFTTPNWNLTEPNWNFTEPIWNFTTPNWNLTEPNWNFTEPIWNFTIPNWNLTEPNWNFTEPIWNFTTPNWNLTEPNWNFTEPIWNFTTPIWNITEPNLNFTGPALPPWDESTTRRRIPIWRRTTTPVTPDVSDSEPEDHLPRRESSIQILLNNIRAYIQAD